VPATPTAASPRPEASRAVPAAIRTIVRMWLIMALPLWVGWWCWYPKELRPALGEILEHSWRPGHPKNSGGRWAGAAADGICRARQVSDPFRSVARFRSHPRGPRMPVMACRPHLAVAGAAPTATEHCSVGHQRRWIGRPSRLRQEKGLGRALGVSTRSEALAHASNGPAVGSKWSRCLQQILSYGATRRTAVGREARRHDKAWIE